MTDIERVRLFLRQVRRRALLVFGLRAAGFTQRVDAITFFSSWRSKPG